eukprot:TRINITY_DN62417_c0_g1_i1.p1 TRINITY_DN62417_c0_g1~~TRINITY_DN62417_c0_g1_i1.p1  ORF type:complete len:569 (-),score=74.63 TRINITY_DN62417_c0_g1_i1:222-1928(-)
MDMREKPHLAHLILEKWQRQVAAATRIGQKKISRCLHQSTCLEAVDACVAASAAISSVIEGLYGKIHAHDGGSVMSEVCHDSLSCSAQLDSQEFPPCIAGCSTSTSALESDVSDAMIDELLQDRLTCIAPALRAELACALGAPPGQSVNPHVQRLRRNVAAHPRSRSAWSKISAFDRAQLASLQRGEKRAKSSLQSVIDAMHSDMGNVESDSFNGRFSEACATFQASQSLPSSCTHSRLQELLEGLESRLPAADLRSCGEECAVAQQEAESRSEPCGLRCFVGEADVATQTDSWDVQTSSQFAVRIENELKSIRAEISASSLHLRHPVHADQVHSCSLLNGNSRGEVFLHVANETDMHEHFSVQAGHQLHDVCADHQLPEAHERNPAVPKHSLGHGGFSEKKSKLSSKVATCTTQRRRALNWADLDDQIVVDVATNESAKNHMTGKCATGSSVFSAIECNGLHPKDDAANGVEPRAFDFARMLIAKQITSAQVNLSIIVTKIQFHMFNKTEHSATAIDLHDKLTCVLPELIWLWWCRTLCKWLSLGPCLCISAFTLIGPAAAFITHFG